jgi:hypothetical protein
MAERALSITMPKGEEDGVKDMEKETIQFHGKTGKVTWIEFEKSIARYFRMKFGSEIGNKLWRNEMPVIEGAGAIDDDEFEEHCDEVLEAISNFLRKSMPSWNRQNLVSGKLRGTLNGDRGNGLAW